MQSRNWRSFRRSTRIPRCQVADTERFRFAGATIVEDENGSGKVSWCKHLLTGKASRRRVSSGVCPNIKD
jgi:hypothetical protein